MYENALAISSLSMNYGKKIVLKDINFFASPFTITAVVGKNGCGKSSLVSCINGERRYFGKISAFGEDLAYKTCRERAKIISVLPQTLPRPHMKVFELVGFGRSPYIKLGQRLSYSDKKIIYDSIERIGISRLADCFVDEISGGEVQKAYLAMILCQNTSILVLDEPTAHMDIAYENEFLELLQILKTKYKKTIITVLHELNLAVRYADQIAIMDNGKIVISAPTKDILDAEIIEKTFKIRKYVSEGKVFFSA